MKAWQLSTARCGSGRRWHETEPARRLIRMGLVMKDFEKGGGDRAQLLLQLPNPPEHLLLFPRLQCHESDSGFDAGGLMQRGGCRRGRGSHKTEYRRRRA